MSKKLIDRPTEIRDDEKLNNSKLFEYLSEIIDLDIESFDILQFPSGYSNLTYLIKSNEKEYVLRKPPHGAKIKSGHDMSREFKVLSSLKDHYHKTPDPIHYCSNTDIIGSDFYLMERVKGVILRSNNYSQIVKDKSQFNFESSLQVCPPQHHALHRYFIHVRLIIGASKNNTRQSRGLLSR